jgi:hypothetical protein
MALVEGLSFIKNQILKGAKKMIPPVLEDTDWYSMCDQEGGLRMKKVKIKRSSMEIHSRF